MYYCIILHVLEVIQVLYNLSWTHFGKKQNEYNVVQQLNEILLALQVVNSDSWGDLKHTADKGVSVDSKASLLIKPFL